MKDVWWVCGLASWLMVTGAMAAPVMVDDAAVAKELTKGLHALADKGEVVSSKVLNSQLGRTTCKIKLPVSVQKPLANLYSNCADSVVVIGTVFKCGHCDKWHNRSSATGWVLTEKGVMVTNYHVFEGKDVAGFGIRTRDGKVAAVTEILAASKRDDVVIFKVSGTGFNPLALAPDAAVGSELHVIAHPAGRYYTYTSGRVSRYYRKRIASGDGPTLMAVTAEFARGSSGGPVMNSAGNVIGMVSSTQSIYTSGAAQTKPAKERGKSGKKSEKSDRSKVFQMIIRNCVPVSAIRALIHRP